MGVASQNMCINKVSRQKGNQYFANVALKVNVKFAGACNQRVQGFPPGFQVPTIVFGAE